MKRIAVTTAVVAFFVLMTTTAQASDFSVFIRGLYGYGHHAAANNHARHHADLQHREVHREIRHHNAHHYPMSRYQHRNLHRNLNHERRHDAIEHDSAHYKRSYSPYRGRGNIYFRYGY